MADITEEFVEKEVQELKSRDDVKAVAIFGSYARNPDQDHNDLDIYTVVDGDWRKRETEIKDDIVIERFFNPRKSTIEYIESDWWKMNQWLKNADIRYDPEDIFSKFKEETAKVKEERLSNIGEDEILYTIWDKKQDLEKTEDIGQKRYLMNEFFNYLLYQNYLLNDEVPVKDNYRIKKLQDFDGYMYKLAQEFLLASSTMEKEQKLEKVIKHVTKDLGEPNPEWKTDKENLG